MPRFIVNLFKFIAIVFAPIAVIGFVVSKREISGNQYAAVLEVFGNGSVKGFAVTLSIGIMSSMFTAILLTRMLISIWLKKTRPKKLSLI